MHLQPGEDPFTQLRQEKRDRLKKQNQQQTANVKQAVKSGGAAAVPATLRLAATLPEKGKGKPTKRKEMRDEVGVLEHRPYVWPVGVMMQAMPAMCAGWGMQQQWQITLSRY